MSATLVTPKTTSGGEIITHLINATDGEGLHFDGAAGNIDIASPPDLGAFAVYINNGAGYATTTTTMTVDALSAEIPAGTVLTFSGGGEYIVTTTAAASATSIVSTSGLTGAAVADNEGAAYGGANKFSFEFIVQVDSWNDNEYFIAFGTGGQFVFGVASGNLAIYDNASWVSLGTTGSVDDLKPIHLVLTIDSTSAVVYSNGNQVGTATISASHGIDNCTDAKIGSAFTGLGNFIDATFYRARFWNKTLSQAEVTASYENATVPFADQYGSQTELVANGGFASDTGWTKNSAWSIGSGVATADGSASNSLYQSGVISSTGGKRYRYSFDYTRTSGTSLGVQYHNGSSYVDIATGAETGTNTATGEFVTTGTPDGYIYFTANGNWAGTLDNVTLVAAGCVSDYDLAFANPTQSTMVQDRAGAADGTASSGVTQVTPLVQVNATAARIGTSAATPADGELLVGGSIGAGGAPTTDYGKTVHVNSPDGLGASLHLTDTTTGSDADDGFELLCYGVDAYVYNREAGPLFLGTNNTERLTIDSAGKVGIGRTPTSSALEVNGGVVITPAAGTASLTFSGAGLAVINQYSNYALELKTNNTLAVSIANSGLATFSNGISLGNETLDSYDEGTFTATLTADTPPTTPPTTTGTYVKVGKMVTVAMYFSNVDTTGASGYMKVTGMPFAAGTVGPSLGGVSFYNFTFNDDAIQTPDMGAGATEIIFLESNSNVAWSLLDITAGTGRYMKIAGTYITA